MADGARIVSRANISYTLSYFIPHFDGSLAVVIHCHFKDFFGAFGYASAASVAFIGVYSYVKLSPAVGIPIVDNQLLVPSFPVFSKDSLANIAAPSCGQLPSGS